MMIHRRESRIVFNICDKGVRALFLLLTVVFYLWGKIFFFRQLMFDVLRTLLIVIWEHLYFFAACHWGILSLSSKYFFNASVFLDVKIFETLPERCWRDAENSFSKRFKISEIVCWSTISNHNMLHSKIFVPNVIVSTYNLYARDRRYSSLCVIFH